MRAIVVDHAAPARLRLAEVPDPVPAPHEALVAVRAISVNPGELAGRIPASADGDVPGWEAAGAVVQAAADGSGPAVGEHVATFGEGGGWAELRAVATATLGVVPSGLDLGVASTLPIAAASALRGIRTLGAVVGRRLLVTGATGAVGRFAVQVGAAAGAEVVAVARDAARHDELRSLGAAEVHASVSAVGEPVHDALDTVGGAQLAEAFRLLRARGTLVSVGRASGEPVVLEAGDLVADHGRSGIRLRTFFLAEDLDGYPDDVAWLARRADGGALRADVAEHVAFGDLAERLAEPLRGKLVARLG